jgi:hypothetical protein
MMMSPLWFTKNKLIRYILNNKCEDPHVFILILLFVISEKHCFCCIFQLFYSHSDNPAKHNFPFFVF